MNNFKSLNDKYGQAVGDLLWVEAARRINSCLREDDAVARFDRVCFYQHEGKKTTSAHQNKVRKALLGMKYE